MSTSDQLIEEMSEMPLFDAAYYLATNIGKLSPDERGEEVSATLQPVADRDILGSYARVEAGEYNDANVDRDGEGSVKSPFDVNFNFLSRAHPQASEEDVKSALRAASKLSQDALSYFSYGSDYIASVTRAVDLARRANPGFQEKTYQRVANRLAFAMR